MNYRDSTIWSFLEMVSSPGAVPAGGSVAAVAGAMASALMVKMGRLALRREGITLSHDLVIEAEGLRRRLIASADSDARAYQIAAALQRSEGASGQEIEAAWQDAVSVPLQIAINCNRLLDLAETLRLVGLAAADVRAIILLAQACLRVQLFNAEANLARVQDAAFRHQTENTLILLRERGRTTLEVREHPKE